ncbi:MAG: ABC transporter permease [Sedimentisphaerales bacterium]|nr:ABC transporter permease [Sedimentisphaerales bacterium]
MLILALSNLTHRKVRTCLSILAVAISITLLLVLVGLSHGTLNEISQRMQSVEAEIIVRDRHFDLGSMSGGKLWEKEIEQILQLKIGTNPTVERVIPVFLGRMKLGGLSQNVFGVHPEDFSYFAGNRRILEGYLFTDIESPAQALARLESPNNPQTINYLPLLIDKRLSNAARLNVGDTTTFGDTMAQITGIVETGVAGRVFAPINMLRAANGISAKTAHLFFVKAGNNLNTDQLQQLCDEIETKTRRSANLVANYGQVLEQNFQNLTIFVGLVSVIALVICFLFILVTMHTIVLERSKEIAIIQSLGAARSMIMIQTIQEALIICILGCIIGIVMSFGAKWLIETYQPLMTVEMRLHWLLLAVLIGVVGGVLSALVPGYMALRRDPVEVLSFE